MKTAPIAPTILTPQKTLSSREPLSLKKQPHPKTASKKKEKPKKSIWHSVWFGLAGGILAFFINILPEKIGKFLSQLFSSFIKTDNPFIPEAD